MKKLLLIVLILIVCGCTKNEDIPNYVIEDIKNYMSEHYEVKIEEYVKIEDTIQAEKYGLDLNESRYVEDDVHVYKLKTNEFDFYAFNYTTDGAMSYKHQDIFTNITAVLYKKNLSSIKLIASKYNVKVVDNLPTTIFNWEDGLEFDFTGLSQTTTQSFLEELLTLPDIKKLVELKYEEYEKDDGTISFSSSGWDDYMIWDYSSVDGYYDTTCTSCKNLLTVCAREYYK